MSHTKTNHFSTKGILGMFLVSSLVSTTTLADDYMYVEATHLNIRSAGTFRSSIVATVDNGYKVTVIDTLDNGWKKVLLENGQEGYTNGRYLVEKEPYFEKAHGSAYTVTVPRAFVRGEGLVNKVAVLGRGDALEIMNEKVYLGKWLRVKVTSSLNGRYNERVGYISKKLATVTEESKYEENVSLNNTPEEGTNVNQDTSSTDDSWITDNTALNSAPAESVADTVTTDSGTDTTSSDTTDAMSGTGTDDSSDLDGLLEGLLQ